MKESVVRNHNVVCTHNKSDRSVWTTSAIAFYPTEWRSILL
ncbi:MAG: hypothetical protein ACYTXC_02405 [Nostoc sp.]